MESLKAASDSLNNSAFYPEKTSTTFNNTEIFSVFGDASCGEPFSAQRVRLDFTPNQEIDNDYVQNKCCAFWDFINSIPEIQNLMVKPEHVDLQMSHGTYGASTSSMENKTIETGSRDLKERTALSMLEFAEEKGLIDRTFEAKIHESHCTLGSREYRELEKPKKRRRCGPCLPHCVDPCSCPDTPSEPSSLKTLVRSMQDWDKKHPKSIKEPAHAPSIQHSILQRKVKSTDSFQ